LPSRCHRIGQTRPVTVYKLVSLATVDEDIYKMQVRKSEMNAAIMGEEAEEAATTSTSRTFDSAKEAQTVLRDAVDRYLRSPTSQKKKAKKSSGASTSKENGHENESAADVDVVVLDDSSDNDDDDAKGGDEGNTVRYGDEDTKMPAADCIEID
jgi:hypothetical protein